MRIDRKPLAERLAVFPRLGSGRFADPAGADEALHTGGAPALFAYKGALGI